MSTVKYFEPIQEKMLKDKHYQLKLTLGYLTFVVLLITYLFYIVINTDLGFLSQINEIK